MAALIALVYPDQATAEQAEQVVEALQEEGYLRVLDSARVTKDADGKANLHDGHPVRSGALKGLVLGGLAGVIFAIPVAGIPAGTAAGVALAKRGKHQEAKDFESFAESLPTRDLALLFVDTEGKDDIVVLSALAAGIRPAIIQYEWSEMPIERRASLKQKLLETGYRFLDVGADTVCLRVDP